MISKCNINNVIEVCICNHCKTRIHFNDDDYGMDIKTLTTCDTVTRYKVIDCPTCHKELYLESKYF